MPICKMKDLDIKPALSMEDCKDDEEVFFCETTNEIFRDYKEYFRRIMLVNSTIWACEFTGRDNLTYAEAVKSEKKCRKTAKSFREALRAPVLMVVKKSQQSWNNILLHIVYQFIKDRYFRGEIVILSGPCRPSYYKILEVIAPQKKPENGVYSPSDIKYKAQRKDSKGSDKICIFSSSEIRRRRYDFTLEALQYFLKDNIELTPDGVLEPKEESYKTYVTDPGITFGSLFVGKLPEWKPSSKPKKIHEVKETDSSISPAVVKEKKEKKQETLSKYLVKKNGEHLEREKKEVERLLKEKMEKLQKIKEEKEAELERKRLEQQEKVEKMWLQIATKSDDLERADHKPLPLYKSVKTIIPPKYFGDLLHIKEFIQSHAQIMAANPFKGKISYYEMCRAFTVREVAGPLSDIAQLLLNTIFSLHHEEEDDCKVYERPNAKQVPDMQMAAWTHRFVKKHYSSDLSYLPVDAFSISEVLRLHFLGSGACTDDKSRSWRFNYRNGYDADEDPGLEFKRQQPHILKALKTYTLYQLPLCDIIKILNCLINQILTYSGCLNLLEERHEALKELHKNVRSLQITESKRNTSILIQKKALVTELAQKSRQITDEVEKKKVQDELNRKIERLLVHDEYEKKKFANEISNIEGKIFDYILYLGSDRAYRNYYIFESFPGVFVEHSPQNFDSCVEKPPENDYQLAYGPKNKRDLKLLLLKRMLQEEKEKEKMNTKLRGESNKENQTLVNGDITKINGTTTILPVNGIVRPELPSPYDLWICTGNPNHCIVHDEKNPNRSLWSYIDSEEQLNELIEGLNPFGLRESGLKEQLISYKSFIIEHMSNCPFDNVDVEESKQEKFKEKMMYETNRRYKNTNVGFETNADIHEVMHATLVDEILQFESSITVGGLGKLKVNDLEQWRNDISNNSYNSQCKKLIYGPQDDQEFVDPGADLGDTIDIESEDSSDDGITLHTSPELLKSVKNVASALLQIEQSIEQQFFKEPFGVKIDRVSKDDERIEEGKKKLKYWERSLMASTSYSQVYLHKCILSNAVKWYKSVTYARCTVCNRKGDADKLLLCDDCNAGTHTVCLKPKLKSIPEGNWYCKKCEEKRDIIAKENETKKRPRSRRRVFNMHQDEEEEDEEFELDLYAEKVVADAPTVSDTDRTCYTCFEDGAETECCKCTYWFHLKCVHLKREQRGNWVCPTCRMKEKKRKAIESAEDSEDSDEFLSKIKLKRLKTVVSDNESDVSEPKRSLRPKPSKPEPNNRRSGRSVGGTLPLNTAVLYNLLDEIMKREDAWPFIRPVSQNEVPDYYTVIKNPMDFAKIKSKLNMARYSINEEVMKDIELVFKNCDIYNTQGNDIYKAGVSLEKYVMQRCKKLHLPFTPSDMLTESGDNLN